MNDMQINQDIASIVPVKSKLKFEARAMFEI